MNFTEKLLAKGFVPNIKNFNPKDNWMGISIYHPCVIFRKDNTEVWLKIGEPPFDNHEVTEEMRQQLPHETKKIFGVQVKRIIGKYIDVRKNGKIIYYSLSATEPPDSFL